AIVQQSIVVIRCSSRIWLRRYLLSRQRCDDVVPNGGPGLKRLRRRVQIRMPPCDLPQILALRELRVFWRICIRSWFVCQPEPDPEFASFHAADGVDELKREAGNFGAASSGP